MYFAFGYGLYFYFTWLPTYLIQELGFSLLTGGLFASLPFVLAGAPTWQVAGAPIGCRAARAERARVVLGFVAFSTCAALILASILVAAAGG